MVAGSFPIMRSPVVSVTRQPMARADSTVRVMLSCMASSPSEADMEGVSVVSARRSTVFRTDLLISLLLGREKSGIGMREGEGRKWEGVYQRLVASEHTS